MAPLTPSVGLPPVAEHDPHARRPDPRLPEIKLLGGVSVLLAAVSVGAIGVYVVRLWQTVGVRVFEIQ